MFPLFAKFAVAVVDTGNKLPPISLTPAANLPPVSTTLVVLVANLLPVSLIPVVHLTCKYLREFLKNFEMTLMQLSEAWGKMIHEKTKSKNSLDTVPLILPF